MPSSEIMKEWRENQGEFFPLRDIKQHCKAIPYRRAYTWAHRGVKASRAKNAKKIKLDAVKIGGHLMTTKAAVERFLNVTMEIV